MILHGIVVAAGTGDRFGRPKAQVLLHGRPLWQWARDALISGGVGAVVVVGPTPGGIEGGHRRRDSVAAGLAALSADVTHVLVHDAARPLASPDLVRRVAERLFAGGAEGVVPAIPIRDTVKRVDGEVVDATVERSGLVVVQTPQGFDVGALAAAHATGDDDASDDALLIERSGGRVVTVPGEETNLKITYPADLALAEALAR